MTVLGLGYLSALESFSTAFLLSLGYQRVIDLLRPDTPLRTEIGYAAGCIYVHKPEVISGRAFCAYEQPPSMSMFLTPCKVITASTLDADEVIAKVPKNGLITVHMYFEHRQILPCMKKNDGKKLNKSPFYVISDLSQLFVPNDIDLAQDLVNEWRKEGRLPVHIPQELYSR